MSSLWQQTTVKTAKAKLLTMLRTGLRDPKEIYNHLLNQGFSKYTIKCYLEVYKGYESYTHKTKTTEVFLQKHSYVFKNSYKPRQNKLTVNTYKHILSEYSFDPSIYNLYILMGSHGLRLSEALSVKWTDIDNGFIKVLGKGGKLREVPYIKNSLRPTAEGQELVTAGKYPPSYRRHLSSQFDCSPHDLRHFFVTQIAKKLNIYETASVVGHSDINTTSKYYQTDKHAISKKMNSGGR